MQITNDNTMPAIAQNQTKADNRKMTDVVIKGEVKARDLTDGESDKTKKTEDSENKNDLVVKGGDKEEKSDVNSKRALDEFMQKNPSRLKVSQKE